MRAQKLRWIAPCLLFAACARSPDLEPANAATEIEGLDDAAGVVVSNVQIIVQPDEWPEERVVPDNVTPVLVEIQNASQHALRLEYKLFALATSSGQKLSALPPFNVYGTWKEPRVARQGSRFELQYEAERFEVAPFYADLYEGVPSYRRPFVADQRYYGATYERWRKMDAPLPTRTMQLMALPEGVLHPGGRVAGYLYFDKVPAAAERVDFHLSLVDAFDGEIFAVASVGFLVDR